MNVNLPHWPKDFLDEEELLQSAIHQHANGDFLDAQATYVLVLSKSPKNLIANHLSGILAYQTGRFENAFQLLSAACNINPDYPESFFYRGLVLAAMLRSDDAIADFDHVLLLKPDDAEAFFNKGLALVDKNNMIKAQEAFEKAISVRPDYAKAFFNLGNVLKSQKKLDEAILAYSNALSFQNNYVEALINRGNSFLFLGLVADALSNYERVLSIDPNCDEAAHMISALKGETVPTAPLIYIEKLFDSYALTYDVDLLINLHYKVPKLIGDYFSQQHHNVTRFSAVDLGCGTGLVGCEIRKFCAWLVGVDISKAMLQEAEKKTIYNRLERRSIVDFLSTTILDFDYFVAADVFIYLGELSDVFRLIKTRNKRAGKLVFSIEKYGGDEFFLEQSGRYSHSQNYIEKLCKEYGFHSSFYMDIEVRKEQDRFIAGGLYILEFYPAHSCKA